MSSNSFNINEVRFWRDPQPKNFKTFTTNHPAGHFPIGLNLIDIDKETNARLRAYVDHVSVADSNFNHFKADFHLDAWDDTRLYSARCSWLDVSQHSTDFQFGSFATGQLSRAGTLSEVLEVKFKKPYKAIPKIVTWLTTLDVDCSKNTRIVALATDVTTTGFKLQVNTWHITIIHGATVSWIAVPSDRPNMTAGQFDYLHVGSPATYRTRIAFDKSFHHPPQVVVALNKLDIGNEANLRIAVQAADITAEGMMLCVDAWGDTLLHSVGCAYIAIENSCL
jgi:hypothetical protein